MKRRGEDNDAFLDSLRASVEAGARLLKGVHRRGACWYQRSMADGQKLGEPVLAIVTGDFHRLALEGTCIDSSGETYGLSIYPDGVLDKVVTPTEVDARIKLAVSAEERRLRVMCGRLLPAILPRAKNA